MTDPEKTLPPAERYREAEGWFDDVVSTLVRSPWTLAAFIAWSVGLMVFGFWLRG